MKQLISTYPKIHLPIHVETVHVIDDTSPVDPYKYRTYEYEVVDNENELIATCKRQDMADFLALLIVDFVDLQEK